MPHAVKRTGAALERWVSARPKVLTQSTDELRNKAFADDCRAVSSRWLAEAIANAGSSERAVGRVLGVSPGRVHHLCDPDHRASMNHRQREQLRRRLPSVWREYMQQELEADGEELPGLDEREHAERLMRAVLEVSTSEGPARVKALRRLSGLARAALKDATGEDVDKQEV